MKKVSTRKVLIVLWTIVAVVIVCVVGCKLYERYDRWNRVCEDPYCYNNTYVGRDIYFHNHEDGRGYIYNKRTREKYLKNVAWIAKPMDGDSLVCFSDGKKRGYFSKYTGRVVIEPKYDHAWIFSDGLASVEENGFIKFIDCKGKVVIDKKKAYNTQMEGYVFHGGYCVIDSEDGATHGLMDKTGKIVLPTEYDDIYPTNDLELWRVCKDKEAGVLDKELKTVIPMMECSIYINNGTIDVTMPDHTIRKYDLQGTLIDDFYVADVNILEYETEEVVYRKNNVEDAGEEIQNILKEYYHPIATARLRSYTAGGGYEGLMTADGHLVTMPLYESIRAIGPDLYLCTTTNYDKIVVNGKGEKAIF